MKYLEFYVFKLIANLLLVNLIIFVLFPLLSIHFGLSFIVSVVIPVVLAGAAVERERNKDKQLLLYGIAC